MNDRAWNDNVQCLLDAGNNGLDKYPLKHLCKEGLCERGVKWRSGIEKHYAAMVFSCPC